MSDKPENLEEWFDRNYPETENTPAAWLKLQQQYSSRQDLSNQIGLGQTYSGKYGQTIQNQQDFINTQDQSQGIKK